MIQQYPGAGPDGKPGINSAAGRGGQADAGYAGISDRMDIQGGGKRASQPPFLMSLLANNYRHMVLTS